MRRWNGWGDDSDHYPLSEDALAFVRERVGESKPSKDATRDEVLRSVPESRLKGSATFKYDEATRVDHSRGQSLPDWLAMRYGRMGPFVDGVAFPTSHDEVAATLSEARKLGAIVIPYAGGTSVVGHLTAPIGDKPVASISLEKMNKLAGIDERASIAGFGAGTPGPQVEAQLKQQGYVLGHFPQSYEYSTIGGWVVTRSSGQQSLRYGRIENLFASGRMITPRGELVVGGHPASSAGPDLREAVMGSEGRFGILTEVNARVRPLPEVDEFRAVFFPDWVSGIEAVRTMAQADLGLSMLRLSNEIETETQLALVSGHRSALQWLQRYLGMRGIGAGKCMLMIGITGAHRQVRRARGDAIVIARKFGGVHVGKMMGAAWAKNRFRGPYLRNTLWDAGYAIDTVETSINWPKATPLMRAIEQAAKDALAGENERAHAFTHLSHVYRQGCSIYSTFVYRSTGSYEADFARWQRLKGKVSETIVSHGGTISHQHGVGADHAPYLPAEKGALGIDLIKAMARELDPTGMMNPGKLFA
ncbi:MAG TPA: FAD-binding oxidoreductase [Nevskiaceae bacterium]|nr:FAD-binding oxidoreductase [Nevskiaceae bacterium]